jgi:hypothetical protein
MRRRARDVGALPARDRARFGQEGASVGPARNLRGHRRARR